MPGILGSISGVRLDGVRSSHRAELEGDDLVKAHVTGLQDAKHTPSIGRCPLLGVVHPDVLELEVESSEVAPPGGLDPALVAASELCAQVALEEEGDLGGVEDGAVIRPIASPIFLSSLQVPRDVSSGLSEIRSSVAATCH